MDEKNETLLKLIRTFHVAILITDAENAAATEEGNMPWLHGRPMAIAGIDDDATMWFMTNFDAPKVGELRDDERVYLTFQKDQECYVTISGTATALRDQTKISSLWKEPFRVWFPDGEKDPSLVLLRVKPESGEYWDYSGFKKIRYQFETLKAYFSGTTPSVDDEDSMHAKVSTHTK